MGFRDKVDKLMDTELKTPESDVLYVWVALIEAYEAKHFPISAIKFKME